MAKFCPECGKPTIKIKDGESIRNACPDEHFIATDETAVGVGGLVFKDEKILLIERKIPEGLWALPSGWIQYGETLSEAIEREILEETTVIVRAKGILSVSTRSTNVRNEMYITLVCEFIEGEPLADEIEVTHARFIQQNDLEDLGLSALDNRLIRNYLKYRPKILEQTLPLNEMPNVSTFSFIRLIR